MAKHEQLSGSGEGAGEKGAKKGKRNDASNKTAEEKLTLYERLGGEAGISSIVADFLPRAMQDPRVNWQRKGVTSLSAKLFTRGLGGLTAWDATPQNVATLKRHMVQFLMLATGGPSRYDGKEMTSAHANMKITNPQFDAVVGDLKASLDRMQIPNREQKEVLAIVDRPRSNCHGTMRDRRSDTPHSNFRPPEQ